MLYDDSRLGGRPLLGHSAFLKICKGYKGRAIIAHFSGSWGSLLRSKTIRASASAGADSWQVIHPGL